jgi:hypothetical protein
MGLPKKARVNPPFLMELLALRQEKWRESNFELAPIPPIAIALLLQVAGCPACLGTNRLAGHHKLNPAVGLASRRIIV